MTRILLLTGLGFAVLIALVIGLGGPIGTPDITTPASAAQVSTPAAPEIYASPIHGGCYIAGPSECHLHVDPFTIDITPGKKMALFQLIAIQGGTGKQTVIYDWRPDQSNPAPPSGSTYTPSLVAQDFAATCGKSYEINLQGKDTGDASVLSLGMTGVFTCPVTMP